MSRYAGSVRRVDLALIAQTRADLASGAAREARTAAGIRQSEMAAAIGVARSTVSQWESGLRAPDGDHALAYGRLIRDLAKLAA